MHWRRNLPTPLVLRTGRQIVTIRDAAEFYLTLTEGHRNATHWIEALGAILAAGRQRANPLDLEAAHRSLVAALKADEML